MKEEREARAKFTGAALITIVTILSCCALYFFGGSGFGKDAAAIEEAVPSPTLETAYLGAFEDGIQGLDYNEQGMGCYILHNGDLPAITIRLELEGYLLNAMTLTTQMPVLPPNPAVDATILENRLYAKRKEYFEAQMAWLSDILPVLIRAMDPAGRLTEADAYDLAYYALLTVETEKRQEKTIDGFCLRAYADETTAPPALYISVQDDASLAAEK
ncbi:MAG: hypothetical protein Q4E65_10010 [Clostridia bacterium]|nr:hypothetical protein [Clostridia bacterium]